MAGVREGEPAETLRIQGLGPIRDLTIRPRALTVLVGPQASGKSLVAQTLYFFRDLRGHVGRRFRPEETQRRHSPNELVRRVLNDLRGVPFGNFANGTAVLTYRASEQEEWTVRVYWSNRTVRVSKALHAAIAGWTEGWMRDPSTLPSRGWRSHVFLPTERSLFTRLSNKDPGAPFDAQTQPEPMRAFAGILARAGRLYDLDRKRVMEELPSEGHPARAWLRQVSPEILRRGRAALRGEAYIPSAGEQVWKWRVCDDHGHPVTRGGPDRQVILPLESVASGQSEAWPFFVIAAVFGWQDGGATFYVEEPESHLHPEAQVAVLDTMAFLVRKGCRFVVTTHSPFLLLQLNNLLQAHRKYGARPPNGLESLDPKRVAAYRLGVGEGGQDILDREGTRLIDTEELERVADQLGARFDDLL